MSFIQEQINKARERVQLGVDTASNIFSSLTDVIYSVSYVSSAYDFEKKHQLLHSPTESHWCHHSFRDAYNSFTSFLSSLVHDEETLEYDIIKNNDGRMYMSGALNSTEEMMSVVKAVEEGRTARILSAFVGDTDGMFLSLTQLTVSPIISQVSTFTNDAVS